MTEEEELETIRRVVDGEIEAYSLLVETYQDSLIRMLAILLDDERRLAEDVAQDVMVEAFRRLGEFDPVRSRFSTWLFMIGRSRGINALRKKRPVLLADPHHGTEERAEDMQVDHREDLAIISLAVRKLPPKQKRAFIYVVVEEMAYD